MSKVPNIIPITDLRQDAARVYGGYALRANPFYYPRGAAAVMVSTEEYERSEHDREMLICWHVGKRKFRKGKPLNWKQYWRRCVQLLKEG